MLGIRKWSPRIYHVILSVFLVFAVVAGCAKPAETVQPSAEVKVKLGMSLAFTGALASAGTPQGQGAVAYARWVNDQGGLEFRDPKTGTMRKALVDLVWEDSAMSVSKALAIYKRQKEQGVVLQILAMGLDAVADVASRSQVPILSTAGMAEASIKTQPSYVTALYPSNIDQILAFVKWASQQQTTRPKFGFMLADTAGHRAQGGGGGITAELIREYGGELVGVEWVPLAVTTTTIELTRLNAGNPDWIIIYHVPSGTTVVTKDAQRLGMTGKVKFAIAAYGFGEELIPLLGDLAEGIYGALPWSYPVETAVPGIKTANDAMQKYYGRSATTLNVQGVLTAMVGLEGIRQALQKVGPEGLTPAAVNDALHSLTNFNPMGLAQPITTTSAYPVATQSVKVGVIKGGKIQPVSDWLPTPRVMLTFVK